MCVCDLRFSHLVTLFVLRHSNVLLPLPLVALFVTVLLVYGADFSGLSLHEHKHETCGRDCLAGDEQLLASRASGTRL